MISFKPVSISKNSFAFCRYTVAILVWVSLISQKKWILGVVCVIMALSWILKIERAPLIVFYKVTFEHMFKSEMVMLDESGIRFAHAVGGIMSAISLITWTFAPAPYGFILTLLLAILKTSSAIGRCSALKLYNCMNGGNCCRFGKHLRGNQNV